MTNAKNNIAASAARPAASISAGGTGRPAATRRAAGRRAAMAVIA